MRDLIFTQIADFFKSLIERILLKERENHLKRHNKTRINGYYKRIPKTIFREM